jgi:putative two-component system response regulator
MILPTTTLGRILVVDDDVGVRGLLAKMLERHQYIVDVAGSGDEARICAERSKPDLVLLDVGLPGEDGFSICRSFKRRPEMTLTPVVMMTGLDDRGAKLQGIEAGADDFLSKPFDRAELTARVASLVRIKRYTDELETAEAVIRALALTVEARDPYTDGHCQRLAAYGTALGRAIGLGAGDIAALHRGGYLHDVGKIGIPDAILGKPARLTPDEYDIMKSHTVIGEQLCGELRSLAAVRPIVRHHHERRDGSGYPDGLSGDAIPLLAQIIAIVDEYDAITTTRPYRAALTPEFAFEELEREVTGGIHSRELVAAFIALAKRGDLESISLVTAADPSAAEQELACLASGQPVAAATSS